MGIAQNQKSARISMRDVQLKFEAKFMKRVDSGLSNNEIINTPVPKLESLSCIPLIHRGSSVNTYSSSYV
jgi:hypothetical protein